MSTELQFYILVFFERICINLHCTAAFSAGDKACGSGCAAAGDARGDAGDPPELSAAMNSALKNYGAMQSETLRQISDLQDKRLQGLDERFKSLSLQTELKLDHVRRTMETRLSSLQEDNGKRLEEMRATVDEKLQKTLDDRLTKSFGLVNERLEQVYKGLGEMQTLAVGVGDLKKVHSECQDTGHSRRDSAGGDLKEILTPTNMMKMLRPERIFGTCRVCGKAAGRGTGAFYLSANRCKFPGDSYAALIGCL